MAVFLRSFPRTGYCLYEKTQIFTTDRDNMTELDVAIYQGSSKKARENTLIGKINVRGLARRPKETLNIKITFKVNEEQHVSVVIEEPESSIKVTESLSFSC